MKVLRYLVILSAALFLSCTKDYPDILLKKVTMTKLHTIEGYLEDVDRSRLFVTSYGIKVDDEANLFIYNSISGSIKVFDKTGNFFSEISGRGMGPEEIETYRDYYIYKDTVFVIDNNVRLKKFFKNGNYITTKVLRLDMMTIPTKCRQLNDSTILAKLLKLKKDDDNLYIKNSLVFLDNDRNIKKVLHESREIDYLKYNIESMSVDYLTACNDNIIYQTHMNKSEYKINIFDRDGNELEPITRKYRLQKLSDEELELASRFYKANKFDEKLFSKIYDFKVSIMDIQTDKYGNLWVLRGDLGYELVFDILNKDGELYSGYRVPLRNIDNSRAMKEVLIRDRLYIIDHDENLIDVYDYMIEN